MKAAWAILLSTSLLLAGCGSSATKTYANKDFRFAVTYDTRLTESVETANSGAATLSGPPRMAIDQILVDFTVKPVSDIQVALDGSGGVQVVAAKAARQIPVPTLAGLRQASKKYLLGMTDAPLKSVHLPGLVVGRWQTVSLDGLHGFTVTYSTKTSHVVLYSVYDGSYAYSLLVGAARSAWPGIAPTLNAVVKSFRMTH
jgi:hypothetical protein